LKLEFYYSGICYFARYCNGWLILVVITVCFMTDIHSAIQLTSFLDEGKRDEVEVMTKNPDDDQHRAHEFYGR
jgi:hypothetical protein